MTNPNNIHTTNEQLIIACKNDDRNAQQQLYKQYSAVLFGICRRYINNLPDAEEVLLNGFFKIFTHLHQYEGKGSFEGWMRQVIVNECLMFLRKKNKINTLYAETELNEQYHHLPDDIKPDAQLQVNDVLKLLDELPTGYRTVFNLHVVEGYSLKEVADMLQVSINTTKSQYLKARQTLQKLIATQQNDNTSTYKP